MEVTGCRGIGYLRYSLEKQTCSSREGKMLAT